MEHLLQFVWKHKLFPLTPLHTTQGQTVEVIDPGLPNPDAGPDFFNAKIKIDGILWVGNVEIHVHASDWKRHHHHQDRAYDSVILHVASDIDAETFRTDGTPPKSGEKTSSTSPQCAKNPAGPFCMVPGWGQGSALARFV